LAAAVVAPWLADEWALVPRGARAVNKEPPLQRSAILRVVRAAIDELAAAAEEVAMGVHEPAPDPAGTRILDLAATLSMTFAS
jgi:hypothetical protein